MRLSILYEPEPGTVWTTEAAEGLVGQTTSFRAGEQVFPATVVATSVGPDGTIEMTLDVEGVNVLRGLW